MLKTLKAKLIASFVVINILIIGSSSFNYLKVSESSESFKDYRTMARTSAESSLITSSMLRMRMAVKDYLLAGSDDTLMQFNVAYEQTLSAIEQTKAVAIDTKQLEVLNGLAKEVAEFKTHFESVQALVEKRSDLINNQMNVLGKQMEQILTGVMRTSANNMVYEVSAEASETLRTLLLARLYASKFNETHSKEYMERVLAEFSELREKVLILKETVVSDAGRERLEQVEKGTKDYEQAVMGLRQTVEEQNKIIEEQLSRIGKYIAEKVIDIQTNNKKEQDTLGPQIQDNNDNILLMVLIVAGIIILFGIIVAIIIPRLISKGIESIQNTLTEIESTGRFDIKADDSREDEIGKMAGALNQTLASIQQALKEANDVVSALSNGDFSRRIQINVNGDLDALKRGVNLSVDAIAQTMKEIDVVLNSMKQGQFDVQVNANVKGQFKNIMDDTASTMASMNTIVSDITNVMDKMRAGQFNARVNATAQGQLAKLKTNINESMDSLELAIGDITKIVVAQSQGDLTHSITNDYQGQLDTLKQAINSSVSRLSEVVAQALNATQIVAGAADEVSKGSMDLSDRVQQQASALEETSATMDQMNSAVQGNSRNAQQASQVANEVKSRANEGASVMRDTITAMSAIQESSHKISEIVNLIDGIAFQTNLLALNAAVEAARAGEHGRGFAVVASEVRSLAQKSAEAAKDIKNLIDESVNRIDQGSQLATQSGEMLNEINQEIENFSKMIGDIAQASEEQAQGVNQVHGAIGQIDSVTQQNAALVEETAAAAASMTEQADILRKDMSFFAIKGAASAAKAVHHHKHETKPKIASKTPAAAPALPKKSVATTPVAKTSVAKGSAKPAVTNTAAIQTYKKTEPKASIHDDDQWDEF